MNESERWPGRKGPGVKRWYMYVEVNTLINISIIILSYDNNI